MTRDQYAEALMPLCMRLVATVHDEGQQAVAETLAAIRSLPAPPDVDPLDAVAVVLAAAIDPDSTPGQMWGWTETLGGPAATVPTEPAANPLAREMALAGVLPLHALNPTEQADVVDHLIVRRRWTVASAAAHLDADPDQVARIRHNSKRRNYRARREAA